MSPPFGTDQNTRVQILWEDNEHVLLRRWPDDGCADASTTLALVCASHPPAPGSLDRLAHQYQLKDELDDAWAVRPISLVRDRGQPVLVLEDPGGELLDRLLGAPMELGQFLRLAIGIAMALGKAHQHGLIHKDIRPANILVNSTSGEVRLTGFGISSRLSRERQSPEPPEFVAGTLAYMAPEQTGRMNRSIDSRSDLYSLGVTYYQMLTGRLPFTASSPMEWVHCHIARKAPPPGEQLKNVPAPVSAIIMKLLAKTAEDRYQTAAGVERDLRHCVVTWDVQGRVDEFPLGEYDTPDRLLIPEKLYGRAREIEILLASFDHVVRGGRPELTLVSGYSGIGKSSVVNELQKVLVPPRGLFASGKFDQYKRNIPYATLAQAFQSLVRPLLGRSEADLDYWRNAFREALGPNGLLIVNLVPELMLIIGQQPAVPDLPPQDAQSRFQLVFRRFIGVFARPEHPLALFLDDLQWLDAATLELLEDLLTQPDVRHLLLIGAYRDNEVDSSHPLIRKLEAIRKAGAIVHEIVLAPLTSADLQLLISDSLHCEAERATSLAQLVHEKTIGNPFFAVQFISALAEEGLLTFDYSAMRWSWDLDCIHAKGYTDNVVDLMVGKLNRLSAQTQKALQLFACIGNRAEYALLATAYEGLGEDFHDDLWEAVRTGLVFRSEGAYRFLHDRVQEAAYSQIPEEARAPAHLRIGRLLASRTAPAEIDGRVFEIVNQLNRGTRLITSAAERTRVAGLNLIAGTRARVSTAYASAIEYFAAGRALLTEEDWQLNYELMFGIEVQRAECELLTANSAAAEHRLSLLVERAERVQDIAAVARLRLTLYTTLDRSDRAVEVCLEYLRRGGTNWSPHPTRDQVQREYERIWSQLGSRTIEAVLDLPLMTNPTARAALEVLTEAVTPAHFTDENLLYLIICRMVNLSLNHGNSDGSCFAYAWLGNIAGPCFGSYEMGYRFGRLGYDLVENRGLHRFHARTCAIFGHNVMPWTSHVREGRDLIRRAFEIANRTGDLTWSSYSRQDLIANLLAAGDPLGDTQREAENALEFVQRARFGLAIDIVTARLCLIRMLRGLTPKFGSFNDTEFDELRFEGHLASNERLAVPECWYWILKLQALFLASDYLSAIEASSRAQRLLWTSGCFFERTEYEFYTGLSRAALCDSAPLDERQCHLEELTAHRQQLELWAANCPENFEARATLMAAEIARIEGRDLDAERSYEQAIRSARESGFAHIQGIANELAGRFYLGRGLETNGYAHLRNASACFALWGADGKVKQLELLYPRLTSSDGRQPVATSVQQLDVAAVVKASQIVSGEIVLPRLIERLMTIALQNAGADRGLLVLTQEDGYRVEAEAWTSGDEVVLRQGPSADPSAPEGIVRYVIRTQERVILDDVSKLSLFSEDEYLRRRQPRSLLCLPLVRQGTLTGVLYLENTLTSHAFTSDRAAVLELLASQAAISLENTRLYGELQERESKVRQLIDTALDAVLSIDEQGRITEWNTQAEAMFGWRHEEAVGRPLAEMLIPTRDRSDREEEVRRFLTSGEGSLLNRRVEITAIRRNGSEFPVELSIAPYRIGGSWAFSGFIRDISERKRAEASLQRYHEVQMELAHANRVATMGQMSASIAHEVKQPITAAITNAHVALRWLDAEPPVLEKVRQALGRVVKNGDRADDVIDRIRAFIKKAPPAKDSLEVNETIREVTALTRSEAEKNGISMQTQLAEGLPLIPGDRVQLQQVILNLIINAVEAMSGLGEGSRELVISTAKAKPDGVLVAVRDSGAGLTPTNLERVFDAFYTTKPSGLGMGLSICRSIIEAHGGRLWATASEPHGATFMFTLPEHPESAS
jgi:PAS domain S-box-containing protein